MNYEEIFFDDTKNSKKIKKEYYLVEGKYPIIDQGKENIAGYFNEETGIYKSTNPVIIFGDHTRIIKYIDFPFFLGADGVKILKVKNEKFLAKYLYYALLKFKIPNTGYNRHFKWLKNFKIEEIELEKQKKIVEILDKSNLIIKRKKEELKKLEELKKSLFYEMFGDPIRNEKGWEVKKLSEVSDIKSGGTPSTKNKEYWENGNISWIGSNMCQNRVIYENDGKFITQKGLENSSAKVFEKDVILIALVGATIGKVALLKFLTTTNQNIAGIKILDNKKYKPEYIFYILQFLYPKFQKLGGDKFKMANLSFIKNLMILDVSYTLQNKFAEKVEKIDKLKFEIEQSLKETENLYNSLMQKFFK